MNEITLPDYSFVKKWLFIFVLAIVLVLLLLPPARTQTPVLPETKTITVPGTDITLDLVLIKSGMFEKGSSEEDEEADDDEVPLQTVIFSRPFYVGKYEITQAQWQAVMGGNPSYFTGATRPVEQVSWYDCLRFCNRLSLELGYPSSYDERTWESTPLAGGIRLPTEAEWEYVCRAGETTRYSFGDDESELESAAWFDESSGAMTHPVGSRQPNSWGLYDVHGNVYEWCYDWYRESPEPEDGDNEYDDEEEDSWEDEEEETGRIIRGGGLGSYYYDCRSANRGYADPIGEYDDIGFRVVLPVLEP